MNLAFKRSCSSKGNRIQCQQKKKPEGIARGHKRPVLEDLILDMGYGGRFIVQYSENFIRIPDLVPLQGNYCMFKWETSMLLALNVVFKLFAFMYCIFLCI